MKIGVNAIGCIGFLCEWGVVVVVIEASTAISYRAVSKTNQKNMKIVIYLLSTPLIISFQKQK